MRTFTKHCFLALLVATAAACTMKDVDPPPLMGPSELGMRIALQVVPDSILLDGSQAVLNIDVTGADGRPLRGIPLRIEISESGLLYDFGTLSAKTIVTGDDGRARVTYTAPRFAAGTVNVGTVVTLLVTPIGNDFRAEIPRTVDIELVPPGVIQPPNNPPVPIFTFTPTNPTTFTTVTFDASATTDEGVRCGALCTYAWDFGDGGTATGIFTTHEYRTLGTFQIRLTVTDLRGVSATAAQTITVGPGTPPTASFTSSPSQPAISQSVFFNAEASRAAPGRRIVSYDWDFGDGRTGSGVTTSHAYSIAGTFTVTLVVTDDAGQKATSTSSITVGRSGTLEARLVVSPTSGSPATTFFFDASESIPGPSPIVEYRFTFGDSTPDVVGNSPTATHRYVLPGTYTARVTVRDSAGRTATTTKDVAVN